ncbi:MAG: ionic transporter y4hA [Burkholderiaceae bacterium]|nr:ionic transporter y4hA [Burkholderiaceae bacterium]
MPAWALIVPLGAAGLLAASLGLTVGPALAGACALALIGAVVAAVHHAEVVAHRVGEPFGTLVLAVAITVIEVALIVSMMLAGGPGTATLPRDTIYAAVMIICTGVVGICLLAGGISHHEQTFRLEGTNSALSALVALAGLSLVLPTFTTSSPEGTYTLSQLVFVAASSLALWAIFVFVQTVRHRDYFLPPRNAADEDVHAAPPTLAQAAASFGLLLVALVSVVGLAKQLSPMIEAALSAAGAPRAVLGIAIAMLVLLPETWAAMRAALADRLQTSMNLALGSALASIGLTIPAVVVTATVLDLPLVLGLPPKDLVLLALAFLVGAITLGTGRTNVMQGAVHLVLFAAFLFLSLVP